MLNFVIEYFFAIKCFDCGLDFDSRPHTKNFSIFFPLYIFLRYAPLYFVYIILNCQRCTPGCR
jgi:hypothetical protein